MKRIFKFIWALIKYMIFGDPVSAQIYQHRLSTCSTCEHLNNNSCNICGCYVKKKAKWSTEDCPKNKW